MKKDGQGWDADFPMREEVEDYAGKTRAFVITCHETGLGFTVRAVDRPWCCDAVGRSPGAFGGQELEFRLDVV